jgi:hypothetical protein
MRMVAPGKAMIGWRQPDIRCEDATNSWAEIKESLGQDREALNLLMQITNSSLFDFNLEYTKSFEEMRFTHLVQEKKSAQRLCSSAICNLNSGNTSSAEKNIRAVLTLVNGTHEERTDISQLVRIAIAQIRAAATWELLLSPNLTDEQLSDLQADWRQLEFIQAAEHALWVEREEGEVTLKKWRSSNSELQHYFDLTKQAREVMGNINEEDSLLNRTKLRTKVFLWRYWWSYPDELRCLKGYEVLTETLRQAGTNGCFKDALSMQDAALNHLGISQLNSSLDTLFSGETDFHSMLSESIVTLAGVTRKAMRVEGAKQMIVTAVALKRYQLKHGNYPQTLDLLVPEFVSAIPPDPVDGKPLRYQPKADGTFLLYSVGENGVDDGGDPALEKGAESSSFNWLNPHALDWVWPQPATPEEIQKYYEQQARKNK